MKNKKYKKRILKLIYHFLTFFSLVALITTACIVPFVSTFTETLGITTTAENLDISAKLTFACVIALTAIFTLIDEIRRKYTVKLPAKRISDAADKIISGDFSVRIKPQTKVATDDTFNEIIACFNKMAEELQSVETLRTDFIANVSHEMKTPLSVIQNYGAMLQSPDLPPEKRIEYAEGVTAGSRRLADMMTNILKLNRLENQQIFPQREKYNLGEQLCECLLQYETVWEKSNINIETDIKDDVIISADAELLSLVWNNLFSNAFKFTSSGGTVSLSLFEDGKNVSVKIADTGCGMTKEVGEHIFEKFYQGDTSHSSKGNGLGLALVKRVIDITQGEISVESAVNIGTTFTVRIPKCREE